MSLDVFRVLPLRNQNRGAGPGSSSIPFGTIKNKGLRGNRVILFLSPDCGLYRFCTTCEELLKQGTNRQAHSTVRCCVRSFEDLSYQLSNSVLVVSRCSSGNSSPRNEYRILIEEVEPVSNMRFWTCRRNPLRWKRKTTKQRRWYPLPYSFPDDKHNTALNSASTDTLQPQSPKPFRLFGDAWAVSSRAGFYWFQNLNGAKAGPPY